MYYEGYGVADYMDMMTNYYEEYRSARAAMYDYAGDYDDRDEMWGYNDDIKEDSWADAEEDWRGTSEFLPF